MKVRVITTFPEGAEYAKLFLESYTKHWDKELYVYYEGKKPKFKHRLVKYYSLDSDRERKDFIARNKGRKPPPSDPGNKYRWDWQRFCHKVFALTNERNTKDVDWLIWLDADVITHSSVDDAFLQQVCQGEVSYVGRDHFTHPDCAFVAYKSPYILRELRKIYVSDNLFDLPEWHDSYVFKRLVEGLAGEIPETTAVNLSPGIPGMQVFDDCILGTKMYHKKGPLRKAGLPVPQGEYASQREQVPVSGKRPIEIHTKNCVPEENIRANIHYNLTFLKHFVTPCKSAKTPVTFCSGGPSLPEYLNKIRKDRKKGHIIVCVKTAHDMLIENKIIPDICVLLDPRAHVQDFIENPHPKTLYLVSSMIHPTTMDRLIEKNAKIMAYHAHVGAQEETVLQQRQHKGILIGGGCSAAMRGISVLYALGFSEFHLYGYDLCYEKKPFRGKKLPLKEDGSPKYLSVEVMGRQFWTDPEKVAQAQDFEKMMKEEQNKVEIYAYGPGMVPHLWAGMQRPLPTFEELIGAIGTPSRIEKPGPES